MENIKVEKLEDIIAWKEGLELSLEIYVLLKNSNDFGFRDQIRRAALSIPSNIAEGFDRQTNKEFYPISVYFQRPLSLK